MTAQLRLTAIEIDGTVTRPIRFAQSFGEDLLAAVREAMLKRGCLRDRQHKGQCLNCALLPRCAVWPVVAPADPTRRQRGPYLRPLTLRLPAADPVGLPVGARVTYGATVVQDTTFPALAPALADAFASAARQIAEWGFGLALREGAQAARKGAISVGRVRWVNPATGETQPITPAGNAVVPAPMIAAFDAEAREATGPAPIITFLTPTRLVAAAAALPHPTADVLFRRIAERLDVVAIAAGVAPPRLLEDADITAAIARIGVSDDGTQWVGDAKHGGFVGAVRLRGTPDDCAVIAPALRWGAALGVGKGTLHGAGRFVIGPVPPTAVVVTPTEVAPARVATRDERPSISHAKRSRGGGRPSPSARSPRRERG